MKIIKGIKPLKQFMDDGSMLLPDIPVAYRLLQTMNAPSYMDYDYLLSISGAAVRLNWQPGFAAYDGEPNQSELFVNGDRLTELRNLFERTGMRVTINLIKGNKSFWKYNYSKPVNWISSSIGKNIIIESINKDKPIMIWGPQKAMLVTGYENDGDILYGVCTMREGKEVLDEYNYIKVDNWEKELKAVFEVISFEPVKPNKELLYKTLTTAVNLARTSKQKALGNTELGLSAFDAVAEHLVWDESFEPLEVDKKYEGKITWPKLLYKGYYREDGARTLEGRFWAGYCDFLCMLNGYGNFSRFLESRSKEDDFKFWKRELLEASKCYNKACDYSGELWKIVTPDREGIIKFKTSEVRYTFAAHMLRAKIYTQKALAQLDIIIDGIDNVWQQKNVL